MTVAALYIDPRRGPYPAIPDVQCWGLPDADATQYTGPWPVVAHPRCAAWGRYAWKALDDGHTGPIAVEQVRRWGGVLEHPKDSRLWKHCGLPPVGGLPDEWGGYTIEVAQRDWGHLADKPTFLYIVGCPPNRLPPMPLPQPPRDAWIDSRRVLDPSRLDSARPRGTRGIVERMSKTQRHLSPPSFAEWLVEVARRCRNEVTVQPNRSKPSARTINALFDAQAAPFAARYPRVNGVEFQLRATHYLGDKRKARDFAWYWPDRHRICLVRDALDRLDRDAIVGILRHELGHAADDRIEAAGAEVRADRLAESVFGSPIYYSADGVQNACRGVAPRPAHLPK